MITGKCKARHSWKKTQSTHPRALRRDSWLDLTCEAFSSNCAISRSPIWRTKKSSPHCSKCPSPNDILKQDTVHFNLPFIHFYIQQLHLNCLPLIRTKYYKNRTVSIDKSKYTWSRKKKLRKSFKFLNYLTDFFNLRKGNHSRDKKNNIFLCRKTKIIELLVHADYHSS